MSNRRGAEAESVFCTWALSRGYDVLFPARGLSPPYDVVIHADGDYRRVQVKRAYHRNRSGGKELRVKLTDTGGHKYKTNEVDWFAVVDIETHRIWFFPNTDGTTNMGLTSGKHDKWLVN